MKIAPCFSVKKEKIFTDADQKWKHRVSALLSILESSPFSDQVTFFNTHVEHIFIIMQEWWPMIKIKISKNRAKFLSKYETPGGSGLLTIKEGTEWYNFVLVICKCVWIYKGHFAIPEHGQFVLNWIQSFLFSSSNTGNLRFQCEALQLLLLWIEVVDPTTSASRNLPKQALIGWIQFLLGSLSSSSQEEVTTLSEALPKSTIICHSVRDLLYLITYGGFLSTESIQTIFQVLLNHFLIPLESIDGNFSEIYHIISSYFSVWMSNSSYRRLLKPEDVAACCSSVLKCSLYSDSRNIFLFSDPSHPMYPQIHTHVPLKNLSNALIQLIDTQTFDLVIFNAMKSYELLHVMLNLSYDYHAMNCTLPTMVLGQLCSLSKDVLVNTNGNMLQLFEAIFNFLLMIDRGGEDSSNSTIWSVLINIGSLFTQPMDNAESLLVLKHYSKTFLTMFMKAKHDTKHMKIFESKVFAQEWARACESLTRRMFADPDAGSDRYNDDNDNNCYDEDQYLYNTHYIWECEKRSYSINSWKALVNLIGIKYNTEIIIACYVNITEIVSPNVHLINFMFRLWMGILSSLSEEVTIDHIHEISNSRGDGKFDASNHSANDSRYDYIIALRVNNGTFNNKHTDGSQDSITTCTKANIRHLEITCDVIKKLIEFHDPLTSEYIPWLYKSLTIALQESTHKPPLIRLFSFLFGIYHQDVELCICSVMDALNEGSDYGELYVNMLSVAYSFKYTEIPCFTLTGCDDSSFTVTPITWSQLLNRVCSKSNICSLSSCSLLLLVIHVVNHGNFSLLKYVFESLYSSLVLCADLNINDECKSKSAIQIYSACSLIPEAYQYKEAIVEQLLKALNIYSNLLIQHSSKKSRQSQLVWLRMIHQILWVLKELQIDGMIGRELKQCYKNVIEFYEAACGKIKKKSRQPSWMACLSGMDHEEQSNNPLLSLSIDDLNVKKDGHETLKQIEQLLKHILYQCCAPSSTRSHNDIDQIEKDPFRILYVGGDNIVSLSFDLAHETYKDSGIDTNPNLGNLSTNSSFLNPNDITPDSKSDVRWHEAPINVTIRNSSGKFGISISSISTTDPVQSMKDVMCHLVSRFDYHNSFDSLHSMSDSLTMMSCSDLSLSSLTHQASLPNTGFLSVSDGLKRDLNSLDKKPIQEHIKAGIIYKSKCVTERDILTNNLTSDAYKRFVDLLSVKYADGKEGHRYYEANGIFITFHDSAEIANSLMIDDRYLKRKQYIGNDHIHIVFIEDDHMLWNHDTIKCEFGTLVVLVKPRKELYSVKILCKGDCKISCTDVTDVMIVHEQFIGCFIRSMVVIVYRSILESVSNMPYRHPHYDRVLHIYDIIKRHSDPKDAFHEELMSSLIDLERINIE